MRCLDHQWVANAIRFLLQACGGLIFAGIAGHDRNIGGGHQIFGARFRPHLAHADAAGADECQAGGGHGIGEIRVLRQKAVAGMDRLCAVCQGCGDDHLAAQVGVAWCGAANRNSAIRQSRMLCVGICFGVDRHGANAQAATGTNDAAGNFAAIGDQN